MISTLSWSTGFGAPELLPVFLGSRNFVFPSFLNISNIKIFSIFVSIFFLTIGILIFKNLNSMHYYIRKIRDWERRLSYTHVHHNQKAGHKYFSWGLWSMLLIVEIYIFYEFKCIGKMFRMFATRKMYIHSGIVSHR